ncbi:Lyso-phosphatidylcholine acyltransferase [Dimargaris xerosporica]|nr:Lyso-phosphatidylcholine acyltransferase [Dimargaris xerosporica]
MAAVNSTYWLSLSRQTVISRRTDVFPQVRVVPRTKVSQPLAPRAGTKVPFTASDWDLAVRLAKARELMAPRPDWTLQTLIWQFSSFVVLTLVAMISKLFMCFYTDTEVVNRDTLVDILDDRMAKPRPLITVANHVSALDDPLLWGFLPMRQLLDREKVRWCLAARELLFTNPIATTFFTLGQTMPLLRGAGIFQPYLDAALERLNRNKWVHLFPEGKIFQSSDLGQFRWGVARLVMEAQITPIVVPIWHSGMDKVMPLNRTLHVPVLGQKLKVVVGEPLDFAPLLARARAENWPVATTRALIAANIKASIKLLAKEHGD